MQATEVQTLADAVRDYLAFLAEEKHSGLPYEVRMATKREKLAAMRRALAAESE